MLVFLAASATSAMVLAGSVLGACLAISLLPIRNGKLRGRDRINYDYESDSLDIDQLRRRLLEDLGIAESEVSAAGPPGSTPAMPALASGPWHP